MFKKLICLLVFSSPFLYADGADDKMFPEIPGWKMDVNEQVYHSGDLWELINGAADIFLSYYFEDLHIAEYSKKDQMIRVELYRHKTLNDAYGIYTAERMPDYEQVNLGSQGYKSQGVLNFLAGNYYIKIMSAGIDEADEQTIAMVAGKVEALLAQPSGLPEVLKLFPDDGQINLSDTYIAQNFMGYSFLHHAFSVKYEKPSGLQLFIVKLSQDEILKMIGQYIQMMKEDKVQQKEGLYIIDDLFNGKVFLKQKNEYLIGVVNTENEEIARNFISAAEAEIN